MVNFFEVRLNYFEYSYSIRIRGAWLWHQWLTHSKRRVWEEFGEDLLVGAIWGKPERMKVIGTRAAKGRRTHRVWIHAALLRQQRLLLWELLLLHRRHPGQQPAITAATQTVQHAEHSLTVSKKRKSRFTADVMYGAVSGVIKCNETVLLKEEFHKSTLWNSAWNQINGAESRRK